MDQPTFSVVGHSVLQVLSDMVAIVLSNCGGGPCSGEADKLPTGRNKVKGDGPSW